MYRLYAVLVHKGASCNSGHYYCYVRAPDESWYCMNDDSVTQTDIETVLDQEAYILFYMKSSKKTTDSLKEKVSYIQPSLCMNTLNRIN